MVVTGRALAIVAVIGAASSLPANAQSRFVAGGTVGFADQGRRPATNTLFPTLDGTALSGVIFLDRIVTPLARGTRT